MCNSIRLVLWVEPDLERVPYSKPCFELQKLLAQLKEAEGKIKEKKEEIKDRIKITFL